MILQRSKRAADPKRSLSCQRAMSHPCIKNSPISTDKVNERMTIKPGETGIFYFFFATAGAYFEYLSSRFLIALAVLLI